MRPLSLQQLIIEACKKAKAGHWSALLMYMSDNANKNQSRPFALSQFLPLGVRQ